MRIQWMFTLRSRQCHCGHKSNTIGLSSFCTGPLSVPMVELGKQRVKFRSAIWQFHNVPFMIYYVLNNNVTSSSLTTIRAPVFGRHQFFGTSEHYGKVCGSLLSGWMNYNYTACCWFPTCNNILILPSQFWQIRFESYWSHCSKCWKLVLLRYMQKFSVHNFLVKLQSNKPRQYILSGFLASSSYSKGLQQNNKTGISCKTIFLSAGFLKMCTSLKW